MQRSTNPTNDLIVSAEKSAEIIPNPLVFGDSVARGVCDGLEVAVKRIPRPIHSTEDDIVTLLTQLDHENVLKILAVDDDDGTRFSPPDSATGNFFVPGVAYRYVAMALCEATLDDFCRGKYDGPMPSDLTALNQIADGVKYIHSKGLVHGNIKPTNILISTERPIQLKLSDFELTDLTSVEKKDGNPFNRSRYWMAFEMMQQLLSGDSSPIQATPSSDIFSTGCLFFYFLTRGVHLYGSPRFIVRNILEGNLVNLSQLPKDHCATPIIVQMVTKQPEDRINMKQVVDEINKKSISALDNVSMVNYGPVQSIFSMEWSGKKKNVHGTFSVVFNATYAGVKVAIKQIKNNNLNRNFNDELENAIKILDHPNVLKMYSVVHTPQYKYFAFELCNATLKQYGSGEYKGPIPSEAQGLYQMACGLDYIHSQKLIHRDIKPSNVLISGTKSVQLKWSDFALSKATDEPGTFTPNAPPGTYDWMAPEILRDLMDDSKSSDESSNSVATTFSNIFSAGCVFFFFVEPPLHPFGHEAQIRFNISEGNPLYLLERVETNHFAYDLIAKMINPTPEDRIPLENVFEVLKSFSSIDDDDEDSSRESDVITLQQLRVNQENILAYNYGETDLIGQGSFGPFFADFVQDNGPVAVMHIERSQLAEIVQQEESNWFSIDHENVAKFVANENTFRFRFYATELHLMSLDELYSDDAVERKSFLEIPSDYSFLLQLTNGLDFIHTQGLIYCNINPQNVLLFSLSRVKWANQLGLKMEMTPKMLEWTAPEILAFNDSLHYKYCDIFSDMFSAGCVFFFFLTKGVHLFGAAGGTNEISKTNILQCKKRNFKVLAKELWIVELIEDLTENDPKLRPCAADVIKTLISSKRKLNRLDKEKLSTRYFSDIRSSSPGTQAIPNLSSSNKGSIEEIYFPEIKGVSGKIVTYHLNSSGVESFVFEGEKVSRIQFDRYNLGNINILKQLHHPNVIKPYFRINGSFCSGSIVPHCVASLDQLFLKDDNIKKYRGPMPTDEQVLFQLASGLDYIHSKDIIHRNIRPENILIMTASSKWVKMKISNFNDAVRVRKALNVESEIYNYKSEESIYWVPPIKKTPSGYWERIAPKFLYVHCDTFSCGCVLLYFLLRGIHPFGSINLVIPTNIARANPVNLKDLPENHFARSFISRMIEIDPELTIPLSQVVDDLKSLLPNGYLKTRNRLSNLHYFGNLNLVHSGPLSSVHYVTQEDGTEMAVKKIPLDVSSLSLELTSKVFDELKALHHPNIVKMFEFDHDRLYRYFSMEFFKVSLDEWFNINNQNPEQNPYRKPPLYEGKFLFQLTSGLLHIHAEGFVHGSIKPSNIFVIEYDGDLQIKLSSDFGIIRENHLDKLLSSTPNWLAPELLESLLRHSSKQITAVQCTKESDTFAAGNAFFYYWSRGQNLFSKNNNRNENEGRQTISENEKEVQRRKTAPEILTNILNGNHVNLFDFTSTGVQEIHQIDGIKGVIRWMTQKDPKQRPSLHQIIEYSPFLNRFPPPADKLEGIAGVLISNHQQRAVQPSTSLQIQYSKDHVLGISADGQSKVFLGLAVKTTDIKSRDWNNLQPVPVAVKRMANLGAKPQGEGKIILKTSAVLDQERSERAKILMNLNHENVVKLYSFAKNLNYMALALEKCRTSLADYIGRPLFHRDFIKMPSDKDVLLQMARGLDYIHSQNLIYRDVKPEKVLISENSVMKWSSDFGISRAVAAGQPYFDQSKFTGSERWLPNEIIDTSQANRLFNFTLMSGSIKCDTFALGCIFFFYLSSGIHPFGDDYNIQENIRKDNPINVDQLSSEHFAFHAIKRMITKDVLMRPKLSDVIVCLEKETPLE